MARPAVGSRLVPWIFPFRRLAAWLAALILLVGLLALAVSALVVVPFLEQRLLDQRVEQVRRTAATSGPALAHAIASDLAHENDIAISTGRLTGTTVYLYAPLALGQVLAVSDPAGPPDDAIARAAAAGPDRRVVRGLVRRSEHRYAEAAISFHVGSTQTIALFVLPAEDVGGIVGVVRERILIAGVIALPIAVFTGLLAAYVLAGRIRRLERAARRIASGDFAEPVVDEGHDEVGQLAAAFDDMRRQLERTDRARREFIQNASHELRTPLFALGGYLELIEDDPDDHVARTEFVGEMRSQVDRLTRLATDLLDLSRLDAGHLTIASGPVALDHVAATVAAEFRARAEQRGTALGVAGEAGPGVVVAEGDEQRVAQIARALVENALRHTAAGTHVELRPVAVDGRAQLAVHDDGAPIAERDRQRIFDRFERASGGEGSGLGLAIARELAARMDGELRLVQDAEGKAFVLDLPAARDDEDEETA